jgi:polysaccharide export outer membrane protein
MSRIRKDSAFTLALLIGLIAFPGVLRAQSSSNVSDEERYRIGIQDTLDIQVFKHPELTQRVTVTGNGVIFLPRLEAPISAICKTERELADEIANSYRSFLVDPFVNVTVADLKSQAYGVIGAVEKPGTVFVSRRIQLLELLALAGGPNKEAGSRLIVARLGSGTACRNPKEQGSDSFLSLKIRDLQEGKQNIWMRPGDVVSVLDADVVYVYGSVEKPGEVKIRSVMTLRQAIASASGFSRSANKGRIRLIRQATPESEWIETSFDLKDIDSGKVKDPILSPNDIVAVSNDPIKTIFSTLTTPIGGALGNLPIVLR